MSYTYTIVGGPHNGWTVTVLTDAPTITLENADGRHTYRTNGSTATFVPLA